MPLILTLDAALAVCSAGLVADDAVVSLRSDLEGQAANLPRLAQALLADSAPIDLVAVTVGPGSFTGLRAAIALAHGIAIGAGIPVVGVTVGAALAAMAAAAPSDRPVWTVIDNKRGKLFLERGELLESVALDDFPHPEHPIAVAGDAAVAVVDRLAAQGFDVRLLDTAVPTPLGIARAAIAGRTRPPLPVYVDPPQATPGPAGRPPPA